MTKFEEELFNKVPCKFELTTEAEYKKTTLINHFKNWHSDDEYQELFEQNAELTRENNIVNQINSKLESQIIDLKSQLQQQALPVVPECVAEFITKVKKADNNLTFAFNSKFDECPAKYWNEAIVWRLNHPEEFAIAFITGKYEVEKPQLFYLKNKLTTSYLILDTSTGYFEHWSSTEATGRYKSEFTQSEINSMQTGSYEQIEVAE